MNRITIAGMHTRENFLLFADKINISRKLAENIIDKLTEKQAAVKAFIDQSFLSKEGKALYFKFYTDRQLRLSKNEKLNY